MNNQECIIVKEVYGELTFNIVLEEIKIQDNHQAILYIKLLPQFPFAKKNFDFPIVSLHDFLLSIDNDLYGIDKTYIKNGKLVTLRTPYFAFFTCLCGDMGCAGIYDYIYFIH